MSFFPFVSHFNPSLLHAHHMAEFPLLLYLFLPLWSWSGSLALFFSSSKVKPMLTPKRSSPYDSGSLRSSPTDLRWWRSPSSHLISPCPESGTVPGGHKSSQVKSSHSACHFSDTLCIYIQISVLLLRITLQYNTVSLSISISIIIIKLLF